MAKVKYPVGATWVAQDSRGSTGRIWLRDRYENGREAWEYEFALPDGSGKVADWAPSYAKAVSLINWRFATPVRFSRVK